MANEKISKYIDPIKNSWKKLPKRTHRVIGIVFIGILALAVTLGLLVNQTKYVVLYPGLDHDEAVEVMTELKDSGVSYKEDNGTIYVPSDQENALRMQLANEGHPKTAPNYDYFTGNVNAMTTDREEKVIEKYQLNQRLEAVIKTLDPIDNAYVTISLPDDSGYVLDDDKETATASVTLKVGSGKSLSDKQVSGIKQLVSKSVPNLTADNVSVIDAASGEELSAQGGDSEGSTRMDLTEFKLKVEKQYEDSIQKKVLNILSPQYGEENVKVSVTSKMDLDKRIRDIVTYQPTTSDDKGIVNKSSESTQTTRDGSEAGGVAGAESNTDVSSGTTTYPGVTVSGNTITTKDSKSYEYFVSKVEEQVQSDAADLDDLTVSVLINAAAMTDGQKQSIADSVAVAAGGLKPEKVNVRNGEFITKEAQANAEPASLLPVKLSKQTVAVAAAGLLLVILLVAVGAVSHGRKARKRKELMKQLGAEEHPAEKVQKSAAPAVQTESIAEKRSTMDEKEQQVKKDLQDFSGKNPEIVAQLIRSWLRGDDHHA